VTPYSRGRAIPAFRTNLLLSTETEYDNSGSSEIYETARQFQVIRSTDYIIECGTWPSQSDRVTNSVYSHAFCINICLVLAYIPYFEK
jgi:hypothetical protein